MILNTTFWTCPIPRSTGSPCLPSACTANPTSSATNSVCMMFPEVSEDSMVVGMMLLMNSAVPPEALPARSAAA
jgi:hypothetical protein